MLYVDQEGERVNETNTEAEIDSKKSGRKKGFST